MKPIKGMKWHVSFETKDGKVHELSDDGNIGQFIDFIKTTYSREVLKSPVERIIERWQEPSKE